MRSENLGGEADDELTQIALAADLLNQMMGQLRCLEAGFPVLRAAMAAAGLELHQNLQALNVLAWKIGALNDPRFAAEYTSTAKSTISRVAGVLERLAGLVDAAGGGLTQAMAEYC